MVFHPFYVLFFSRTPDTANQNPEAAKEKVGRKTSTPHLDSDIASEPVRIPNFSCELDFPKLGESEQVCKVKGNDKKNKRDITNDLNTFGSVLIEKITNVAENDTSFSVNLLPEAEEGKKNAFENEKIAETAAPILNTNESNDSFNVVFENLDFITRRKDSASLFLDNVKIPEKNSTKQTKLNYGKKRKAHISDDEKPVSPQSSETEAQKDSLKVAKKISTVDCQVFTSLTSSDDQTTPATSKTRTKSLKPKNQVYTKKKRVLFRKNSSPSSIDNDPRKSTQIPKLKVRKETDIFDVVNSLSSDDSPSVIEETENKEGFNRRRINCAFCFLREFKEPEKVSVSHIINVFQNMPKITTKNWNQHKSIQDHTGSTKMSKQKRLKYDKVAALLRSVDGLPLPGRGSETTRVLEVSQLAHFSTEHFFKFSKFEKSKASTKLSILQELGLDKVFLQAVDELKSEQQSKPKSTDIVIDGERRNSSKKDILGSSEAAEDSDATCSLQSPPLNDSLMCSTKGREPAALAPETPSRGLEKNTGIDSEASVDENPNNGQVQCQIDINYFLANRIQQITKSAVTKTLTLKQVSKLLKCFSRRFPHKDFSPQSISCSGIEKWLDEIYREGKPKTTDYKYVWAKEGSVKQKSLGLGLYGFKSSGQLLKDYIVQKETGFATGEATSKVTSISNEKRVKNELGFLNIFLGFVMNECIKISPDLKNRESCDEQSTWIPVFLENIDEILQEYFKIRTSTDAKGETLKTDINHLKQFLKFMRRTKVVREKCTAFSLTDISSRLDIGSATLDQMLKFANNRLTTEKAYAKIYEASDGYVAFTWLDIQDRLRSLWEGDRERNLVGAKEVIDKGGSNFTLSEAIAVQMYILAYILYERGHRPAACGFVTLFHYKNKRTSKENPNYLIIPVTNNKNRNKKKLEWLFLTPEIVHVFDFFVNRLYPVFKENSSGVTEAEGCDLCNINIVWPAKDSGRNSLNLQTLRSSLMFVSSRCTPLDKPTESLVRYLSKFGYPNITTNDARHIHETTALILKRKLLIDDKTHENYTKSLNHGKDVAEMHYQETNAQVEQMIQSVRMFSEAVKSEYDGPFQCNSHREKEDVTQSVHCVDPTASQIIAVEKMTLEENPCVQTYSQSSGGSSLDTTESLKSAALKDLLKQAPNFSENAIRDESQKRLFEFYRKTQKSLQLMKNWDEKFGLHNDFQLPQKLVFVPFKATIEESDCELKAAGNFPPHCDSLRGRLFVQKFKSCIKNQYINKMVNYFAEEILSSQRTTRENAKGRKASNLEQIIDAILEKNDSNVSLPKKIRAALLERMRKSTEALNRSESRDKPYETEDHLPSALPTDSEFSKVLRQPVDTESSDKAFLEKIQSQKWPDLEMRQSDVEGEGNGIFTLRDIKHREKVIDYHGRYCSLRQYIENTWEDKNNNQQNYYIMALPAFDKFQKRVDKVFETNGTVEKWLSEFIEEELSTVVVVDGKVKCECHNFRSKGPIINHAANNKIANLKKQKLLYKGHMIIYFTALRDIPAGTQLRYQYNNLIKYY